MQLDIKGLAITFGLLWGLVMLLVALANLLWPGYGQAFLAAMASVYPGYHATASVGQVIVGALYGLVDGAICGAVIAWVYNRVTAA